MAPVDGHEGQRRHARPALRQGRHVLLAQQKVPELPVQEPVPGVLLDVRHRHEPQDDVVPLERRVPVRQRKRREVCERGQDPRCVEGWRLRTRGVLGADSADLNNKAFKVAVVGANMNNFSVISGIAATSKKWDVSSAYITKLKTTTAANPHPLVSESDWSYEEGHKIYFFVTFNEAVQVTGTPRLKLNTGNHFEAGAADAYAAPIVPRLW